ncbi:MAG: hypothetical protein IJY81_05045 [Lachnospiraceae bacterium]|nr:hypothetical protein [Lachnospiraceae bacterium]
MKKRFLLLIGISLLTLSACKGSNVAITAEDAKANEIIVTSNKKVQSVIKESFKKKYYKEKALKSFIKDDIKAFNIDNNTKIALNSMKVKDGNVYVVIDYDNVDELNKYNTDTELTKLSVKEAKKSDLIGSKLTKYGKKTKVSKKEALSNDKYKVVVYTCSEEIQETLSDATEATEAPAEETLVPIEGELVTPEPTIEPSAEPTAMPKTTKVNLRLTVPGKVKFVANASKHDKNTVKITTLDKPVVVVYK